MILGVFVGLFAQQPDNQNRIVNSDGKAVSGATVQIVGKDVSVTSNDKGYFYLKTEKGDQIKVDAGIITRVFDINENGTYVLKDYHGMLNVGLSQKQDPTQVSSAISTVYSDKLIKNSVVNPANALYGQLAGLTVLQNGGTPWDRDPDLIIRGIGTLNNNNILIMVDGIERPISSIVLDDIESISVLKDAAALAIYGQRGANGAIVVTTKRGEYESFSVDASYQYGFNMPTRLPKFLDGYQYAQAVNEASVMDGNPFVYSPWELEDYRNGNQPYFYPNVDWVAEGLKDHGISTNFNSQFKGGGKTIRYYSSLNYQTEKGFFNNTDIDSRYDSQLKYTKFNLRGNIDADVTNTTLVSLNINASLSDRKYPFAGVNSIMQAICHTPSAAYPVKSINGKWGGTNYFDNNPVALISSTGYRQDFSRELMGDLTIQQDLDIVTEGLSAEATIAFDNWAIFNEGYKKPYEYESIDVVRDNETGLITDTISTLYGQESQLDFQNVSINQWRRATLRGKINYEKAWGANELSASLIYTQDKYVGDGQYTTILHQNMGGVFQFGMQSKYFADLTLSYSGSSSLPDGDRFGVFPAISGAWIISEEDFLNVSAINFLKLRASWGLTGNDFMPANLYDQQFTNGGKYYFGNNYSVETGLKPGRLATSGLTYETSAKSNVGIDAMLFNNLSLTIDAFYEKRKDILVDAEGVVSGVIGVNPAKQNAGEVENKGIEADIIWNQEIGSFNYYVGGTFSFVRTKIINQNEAFQPYDYQRRTGRAVGQQFGLEAIGYFQDEADIAASPVQTFSVVSPGDIKYKDQNDDNIIDSYDEIALGYSNLYPEIYYSAKVGAEYKGFGFDAVLQGIANQTTYLSTNSIFWPLRDNKNISDFSANRWVPQNMADATLPRLSMDDNANNYRKNTVWLAKADYLKLRSLDIYYNLPKNIVNEVKLQRAKVFVRGMNLFSIDNIKVTDPEETGITYPTISSWHVGVNLGF